MADYTDMSLITRLENYTLRHPQEVLIVHAQVQDEADQVVIFKGFSSSLMRPTAFDPEVAVLPVDAQIQRIDRLQGPYQPQNPQYIEKDIHPDRFLARLTAQGY